MSSTKIWICNGYLGNEQCGAEVEWGENCQDCIDRGQGYGRFVESMGDKAYLKCDACGEFNGLSRNECHECSEEL
jgi:hypothetical protein